MIHSLNAMDSPLVLDSTRVKERDDLVCLPSEFIKFSEFVGMSVGGFRKGDQFPPQENGIKKRP